jgi:hypothetical protein
MKTLNQNNSGDTIRQVNIIPRLDLGLLVLLVAIDDVGSATLAAE